MKRLLLSCAVLALLVVPALVFSQERTPPAGSTSAGSAVPRTGGGDTAVSRGGGDTSSSSSSSSSSSRDTSGPSGGSSWNSFSAPSMPTAPPAVNRAVRSGDAPSLGRARGELSATTGQPVPGDSRPRGDRPVFGYAVPRSSVAKPVTPGGAYYPDSWLWSDPTYTGWWGYEGAYGWYSPYLFGMAPYAGPMPASAGGAAVYATAARGGIKLRVSPKDAEVYVDGVYAGRVDAFDGALQRLELLAGTHTLEIRSEGYDTLRFDVRILPGRTVTYQGALRPVERK